MIFSKPKFWDVSHAPLFSVLLYPLSLLIKLLSFIRKIKTKTQGFTIPIICVGNIYLGGTGKTPLCGELYSILVKLSKKPVFIRKKYESYKDEINLLEKIGPVYESLNRATAVTEAIKNKFEIAILDDGFQDFSIKKNLSIICFNEKQWIGNGFTIPSGPLRESLSSLSRADLVMINGEKNMNIEKKILNKNRLIKIFYFSYVPKNIDEFKNKKIICFAGIGNPVNFFSLLKDNKIDTIEEISFPDHYKYSMKDLNDLEKRAKDKKAILLTTEKDYLRINEEQRKNISFLDITVEIKNKDHFIEEIKKII
tara:strand:- start:5852 stop:6781 length:930 start_codon:yes stop_codon:yes gene_type:complete